MRSVRGPLNAASFELLLMLAGGTIRIIIVSRMELRK